MKLVSLLPIAAICAAAAFWVLQNDSNIRSVVEQYIDNGDIVTFEARFTPEKIMDQKVQDLLGATERTFSKAELKFHPHVLFEVKYSGPDKKTKEGLLLWDLVDGEMVVNCETWDKTHGFEDAINARANRNDFRILNALAQPQAKGKLSIDQLQRELQVEANILQTWLEDAKDKHLIVQKGNEIQLHFQNPKLAVSPQTLLGQCMVTKPYNHAQKISRRYSIRDIEKIAQAAFGEDFTIRSKREVFLPIYSIEFANPDGSILTTYWNALNGKKIIPHYLAAS